MYLTAEETMVRATLPAKLLVVDHVHKLLGDIGAVLVMDVCTYVIYIGV